MRTNAEKTLEVAKKMVNAMIDHDTYEWPPACSFFAYQPKRPENAKIQRQHTEKKEPVDRLD